MMLRTKKGQSIMEYVIVFTAIVAAVLVFSGYIKSKLESSVDKISDQMQEKVEVYKAPYSDATTKTGGGETGG